MVFLTFLNLGAQGASKRCLRRKFLDSLRLHVAGGTGGMGLPKYGGIGGDGGDVLIVGKEDISLKDTQKKIREKRIKATNGVDSHRNCVLGSRGEDVIIEVPVGVTVFSQEGLKLGELNKDGEQITAAKGGCGGTKNNGFSGLKGESHAIILDLKIIADIGLVGFPNAGKSTILSRLSNARPKIASYPFTTIHPSIGLVEYQDLRTLSIADLPGIIEGSHVNFGMGHKFLKHIERTKVLLVVVDVAGFKLSYKYKSRSCLETIILLNKELELYHEDILSKPAVLVVNKMDKKNADDIFKELHVALENYETLVNSTPDQFRPLKPFCFERIHQMTAKEDRKTEIEELKTSLRDVLDSSVKVDVNDELYLMKKLQIAQTVKGPLLV